LVLCRYPVIGIVALMVVDSMVEARGVEPLSEIASTRISPGAV